MADAVLRSKGWNLTAEGLAVCSRSDGTRASPERVIEAAKNTDLREIGEKWLPDEVNRGKCEYVEGPGVLQIQKTRNISAPKDHEESQTAPRMLRLSLTDGQQTCNAIEIQRLDRIGLDTPPGTKICIRGTVEVENGFLLLTNKNMTFVGGRVDKLADNWELKKMLAGQSRANVGSEGGPPIFVPFGQRIRDGKGSTHINKRDNFKSIESNKKEEKTAEELEFEQQRQATIAEALQAKEENKPKTFGGGGTKQVGMDREISRIVEMGFSAEDASRAMRQNDNNVSSAIHQLLSVGKDFRDRPQSDRGDRRGPPRDERRDDRRDERRDDRRDERRDDRRDERRDDRRDNRQENTRGGRGRGRDREEFEDVSSSSRPSGPATLFDFLETKIKPTNDKGSKQQTESNVSSRSHDQYTSNQNQRYDSNHDQRGQRYQGRSEREDKPPPSNNRGGGGNRPGDSRPQSSPAYTSKGQQDASKSSYNQNSDRTSNKVNDRGNQADTRTSIKHNNGQISNSRTDDHRGSQRANYSDTSSPNNYSHPSKSQGSSQENSRYNNPSQNYRQSDGQKDSRQSTGSQNESRQYGGSQNESRQYGGSQNESRQYGQSESKQYGGSQNESRQYGQSESKQYGGSQNESRQYGQSESKQSRGSQNESRQYGQSESRPYNSQNDNRQYNRNNRQFGQNDNQQYGGSKSESRQNGQSESKQYGQSESRQYGQSESRQYGQSESRQYGGSKSDGHQQQSRGGQQNFDKRNQDVSTGHSDRPAGQSASQGTNSDRPAGQSASQGTNSDRPASQSASQGMINKENYNQQQNFPPPSSTAWKKGDPCLAKYWEDNKFYPAVIQALYPDLPTCIVLFPEYGNEEEVNLTDVKALTVPPSQYLPQQSRPQYSDYGGPHQAGHDNHVNSMEFRRRSARTEPNKPTQAYYQPPSQRQPNSQDTE